jgi:anthraniloyl-CoA monooxygenase
MLRDGPLSSGDIAARFSSSWPTISRHLAVLRDAGLVMTEMTDVLPEGRITLGCSGIYSDGHAAAWKRIVEFVRAHSGAAIGIQLAHAGRKGSCAHPWEGEDRPLTASEGAWETIAPSSLPFHSGWPAPREMDRRDMDRVRDAFVRSVKLAELAGFDLVELHMAHGYLLSSFISPLSNRRRDEYGGALENRMRFAEVLVRSGRSAFVGRFRRIPRATA